MCLLFMPQTTAFVYVYVFVCAFFSHYFSLYCCFLFIIIAWWYSFFDKSYSMSSVRSMVTYFCSHLSPLFFGEKISYFLPTFTPTDVHINRNICVPSPHTHTHTSTLCYYYLVNCVLVCLYKFTSFQK